MLQRRGRVTSPDPPAAVAADEDTSDLTDALLLLTRRYTTRRGAALSGSATLALPLGDAPVSPHDRAPLTYTPPYLAEKILTSRSALEGERKQVTVLFADLKGSTELIRDLDPEAAQQLLDPALAAHDGRRAPL